MPNQTNRNNGQSPQFEYRIFGATKTGPRVTEWKSREATIEHYSEADWPLICFERRRPGDDSTIQRKPKPDSKYWKDVTPDNGHVADENVTYS